MYTMRESWTDERLDDFAKHVERRFDKVDHELHRVNDRLDDMYGLMIRTTVGVFAAFVAALVTFVATQL
jgi:hypothetical protein